jgi:arylsulfatase A-like enzyme
MKHLILFSFESLRADVFEGVHPAGNLNRFASEGTVFTHCHTAGVNTAVAQAALLTGQYPQKNGIRHAFPAKLSPLSSTLTEILERNGFYSVASVQFANDFLTAGLLQQFSASAQDRDAALKITAKTRGSGKRTFLFVQSGILHPRYSLPDHRSIPYEERIQQLDQEFFKEWWEEIRCRKLDQDTLIALVGAHGEGLTGERGLGHGHSLDEGAIRVPWILRGPGIIPRRTQQVVSNIDVAPTCLSLLGLKKQVPRFFQGADRMGVLNGKSANKPSLAYAETWKYDPIYWKLLNKGVLIGSDSDAAWQGTWSRLHRLFQIEQQTLRQGRFKWIIKYEGKKTTEELYDLENDPGEYLNLLQLKGRNVTRFLKIARNLKKKLKSMTPSPESPEPAKLFLPLHAQDGLTKRIKRS